jgi:hypothetical protein
MLGHAIAQVVSRWLPTVAARVRARVWSSGICGGQNGAGAGFLRVRRFPLPIFTITLIYHLGLYNRPEVAAVPGDVCPTPQKEKDKCYHNNKVQKGKAIPVTDRAVP